MSCCWLQCHFHDFLFNRTLFHTYLITHWLADSAAPTQYARVLFFCVWESGYARLILSPCFWNTLPVGRTIYSQSSTVAIVTCSTNDAAKGQGRWSHWRHYWHHQWGHYFPNHYLNLLIFPYLFLAILSCLCNLIVPTYSLQSYRAYLFPAILSCLYTYSLQSYRAYTYSLQSYRAYTYSLQSYCAYLFPAILSCLPIPCNLIVPTYSLQSYRAYSLQSYCAYLFPAILLCVPISCNPIMPTYSLQSYSAYLFPAILSCLPIPCNLVMPSSFS